MNSKTAYWLIFASTASIFISSGFNLLKFLLEDQEGIDLLEKEEEIGLELKSLHNVLTSEFAIKIMSYINQNFQKNFYDSFSHIVAKRRKMLFSPVEYEKISKDIIAKSDQLFNNCVTNILQSLNIHFTFEEITSEISRLSSQEKERLFYKYDTINVNHSLSNDQIKNAYELYHSALKNEMKIFEETTKNFTTLNEDNKINLTYQLVISQIRASDVLYLKFNITDRQLIYLIYKSELIDNDSRIKQLHKEMHQMDNIFTTNSYS